MIDPSTTTAASVTISRVSSRSPGADPFRSGWPGPPSR